jgi:hypothetical protein
MRLASFLLLNNAFAKVSTGLVLWFEHFSAISLNCDDHYACSSAAGRLAFSEIKAHLNDEQMRTQ